MTRLPLDGDIDFVIAELKRELAQEERMSLLARTFTILQTLAGQAAGTVNGAAFKVFDIRDATSACAVSLVATKDSGTGTLDTRIEDSPDGTNWALVVAFTQLSASGNETKALPRTLNAHVRAVSVVAAGASPIYSASVGLLGEVNVSAEA